MKDFKNNVAIVTGGSAGIGYFDALELARANAQVILISANEEKGQQAEAAIKKGVEENENKPTGSVSWYRADFTKLKEVDDVAKKLAKELERLDILICNAGIGQAPYGLTSDGLERHFEVR